MAVSIPEFWKLLKDCRLLSPSDCLSRKAAFEGMKGADRSGSARSLAEWLVAEGGLTRYQSKLLLAGRSGPFYYGDYRIHELHDHGRLKGRFQAVHVPSGHMVTLDFVSGPLAKSQQLWAFAAGQAEIARSIVHPQISRFYELVDLVTFKFSVLEDLHGESLKKLLGEGQPLPPAEACRIARLVALGLTHVHSRGQVYGEIRSENIWIQAHGNAKLLGVPLCREFTSAPGRFSLSEQDSDGQMLSKADYLAPELARAGAQATPLSDIYALGCLLHELLTGRVPFPGGTAAEKVHRHATQAIDPMEPYGVPPQLAQVVAYMMAKDSSIRYQQASQLVEAMTAFVDPSAVTVQHEPESPSAGVYESQLHERHAALTRQAAAAPVIQETSSVAPRIDTSSSPSATTSSPARSPSVATSSSVSRKREKSYTNLFIGLGAGVGLVVILAVMFSGKPPSTAYNSGDSDASEIEDDPEETELEQNSNTGSKAGTASKSGTNDSSSQPRVVLPDGRTVPASNRETPVIDDGRSLWASPTSGPPLSLRYLPPGAQIFVSLRPAELFLGGEGEKLLAALGPRGVALLDRLRQVTAFDFADLEHVLIALHGGVTGSWEPSFVVRLREPTDEVTLTQLWNNPQAATHAEKSYFTGGGWAYYIPSGEESRTFVISSPERMGEILDAGKSEPPLRREMEQMLSDTDSRRHFTVLLAPNYLFSDGKKAAFAGPTARMEKPLFWFLGDNNIKAALLSLHVDQNLFAELRLTGTLDISEQKLVKQIHGRLSEIPDEIQKYIVKLNPHPYTLDVLAKFPRMIETLYRFTRSGIEHDQAVIRSYLPAVAAHNLLMGAELALAQQPGAGGTVITSTPSEQPKSVEEILEQKASLSFPRDTLEISMQLLSKEIGVDIRILGSDLQLDGITKNQSFGIDLRDQPARKILERVMILANPDKTVKDPSEAKQKLVYLIKPKEGGTGDMIYISTRQMAEKRGDKLPKAFVIQEDGKKTE